MKSYITVTKSFLFIFFFNDTATTEIYTLSLHDALPISHLALARHLYHGYFDYDHARDELAIAARTLPNDARIFEWTGYIDRRQNRWHEAVRNFERAMELDPRNVKILTGAAVTYNVMRGYGQARETS